MPARVSLVSKSLALPGFVTSFLLSLRPQASNPIFTLRPGLPLQGSQINSIRFFCLLSRAAGKFRPCMKMIQNKLYFSRGGHNPKQVRT